MAHERKNLFNRKKDDPRDKISTYLEEQKENLCVWREKRKKSTEGVDNPLTDTMEDRMEGV